MSCSTSRIAWPGFSAASSVEHALGFLGAHAGERLVEQQHLRRGREAHRDFELPLLAVRKRARDAVRLSARGPACSIARCASAVLSAQCAAALHQIERVLVMRLRGQPAVLEHRERGKIVVRW